MTAGWKSLEGELPTHDTDAKGVWTKEELEAERKEYWVAVSSLATARPLPGHGTLVRYKAGGCRCASCASAYRAYERRRQARRNDRLALKRAERDAYRKGDWVGTDT